MVSQSEHETYLLSERLSKDWVAPVYVFFKPDVEIHVTDDGKRVHVFTCSNRTCKTTVKRWLDKKDRASMSNL